MVRNFQSLLLILVLSSGLIAQGNVVQINSPTTGELVSTSFLPIDYSLAAYFDIGDSACTNCDGFIRVTLNYAYAGSFHNTGPDTLQDVTNGQYLLGLEAVDPDGNSFDPEIMDTVNFTIVGNPELCEPGGLTAYAGDERNVLVWNEPFSASSENPFPATPNSADYNTGSTDGSSFTENSEIKGHGGPSTSRESGWARFSLLGMSPAVNIDSVVFNYYVNETNWPYWSVTPVSVDPLTADATTLHTDINAEAASATESYLYQFESSAFSAGFYTNTLINNASSDLSDAVPNGYFVIGVVDRDGIATYYLDIDGWNEDNPPSLDVYWSAPGGRQGVYNAPAISNDINFNPEEIDQYKNAISNGTNFPDYLNGIADYETNRNPNLSSRDVGIVCGTFEYYEIYERLQVGGVVATTDTNYYVHDSLTNNTLYCYYISAVYSEGESDTSGTVCATPETYVPDPVTNLSGAGLDEEALIFWTSPTTPEYVYYTSFEDSAAAGFTGQGGFEIGQPDYAFGPEAGSGTNCWGTNLIGPYENSAYATLTSPVFDISDMASPIMQINHWYQIESYWDGGNVKISTDGGATWVILLPEEDYPEDAVYTGNAGIPGEVAYSGTTIGNFWHTVQFTLNPSDSLVQFRFDFGSDASVQYAGWYIDDFVLMDGGDGRDLDGELNHYKVYQAGTLLDSTTSTSYLATGLTNNQSYTFGITANYYPNFESALESITLSPTWLYGDITGTITDPNGDPLDSAIVNAGVITDTTGTDGIYVLSNLDPGLHNVVVKHPTFDNDNADVTAIAQEDAIIQDFTLIPKLDRPGSLEVEGVGQNVYLTWFPAGSMQIGCGDKLIPSLPYSDLGTNVDMGDDWPVSSGFTQGEDYAYTFYVFEDITIDVTVCNAGTDYDTKLEIFTFDGEDCAETYTGAVTTGYYNDDFTCQFGNLQSSLMNVTLPEGQYYIVVDGWNGNTGNYVISVTESEGGRSAVATAHMLDVSLEYEKLVNSGLSPADARTYVADFKAIYFGDDLQLNVSDNHAQNMPSVSTRTTTEDSLTGYNIYQVVDSGDSLVFATYGEDTTAVISVPENYVEYCFFVKARWYTSYGELESKATSTVCTIPYLAGDVNSDDVVDVSDLLSVIDFILEVAFPTEIQFRNSDLNQDDALNVADVIMMIDIIFPGGYGRRIATDVESIAELSLRNGGGTSLLLDLAYDGVVRGIQFDLSADMSSLAFGSPLLNELQEGVLINSHTLEDGSTRVLAVNMNGGLLAFSANGFITIPVMINTGRGVRVKVDISGIQLIGQDGQDIPVQAKGDGSVALELIPMQYALYQNFPNPFNPVTEIQFDVPDVSAVDLVVYNLMGQQVRRLVSSELQAGYHRMVWDGLNDRGESVSTGVYIYSLTSPSFHNTKKMVLLK